MLKKDFDAWAYNIVWPQTASGDSLFGRLLLTAEDVKFAFNAWSFLRLAMFFGTSHPRVLSGLDNTTPSLDIAYGGNRLLHMHCDSNATLRADAVKVALTPNHPDAVPIQRFSFAEASRRRAAPVELVVGMENGLSESVVQQCDHCVYIPQYGSIGSLSMLSAMSIATHLAASSLQSADGATSPVLRASPTLGHMPLSNASTQPSQRARAPTRPLPHERDLMHLSNEEIRQLLEQRRRSYAMQLSVVMYNEYADRNISAVIRNANAYNCEEVGILNRRKFNRRGAVGTHFLQCPRYLGDGADGRYDALLEGSAAWLVYPYYPYIRCFSDAEDQQHWQRAELTYLRPSADPLLRWLSTDHRLSDEHPLVRQSPGVLTDPPVYLDSAESVFGAVRQEHGRRRRGIFLAVAEEGCTPHPLLSSRCTRVVFVKHPSRLPLLTQRGISPALSTAIAFERIRSAIDSLSDVCVQ